MAIVIADVAKIEWLKRALYGNASAENITQKLFKSATTPADSDVAATFTPADFTGYSNFTLTSSQSGPTWAVPTASGNIASSIYGTTNTLTATTDQTVYGIYWVFATSGILALAQAYGVGRALIGANSDQISVINRLQANDF